MAPSLARNLTTPAPAATQMFVPSNASDNPPPTGNVPRVAPSLARSLVKPEPFNTQMFVPSKATPVGKLPAGNVPKLAPSLALSLVIVLIGPLVDGLWGK